MKAQRIVTILATGAIAGIILLLGPQACRATGDAMVDAGEWIRDAGDAAEDAVSRDANAQDSGTNGCSRWEISNYDTTGCHGDDYEPMIDQGESCSLPAGWEPFGVDTHNDIVIRRCLD